MGKEKEKFLEIQELFKRLRHEISNVVEVYYIWKTLVFARSVPEVGEEKAKQNAKIMNLYKYFFIPIESSLVDTFIIGLSKFFDNDSRALSFSKLISIIKENKDQITPDVLLNIYPNRFDKEDLTSSYIPLDDKDIRHFKELKQKNKLVIEKLKIIRNKQAAHIDLEVIEGTFIPNEIESLIFDIQSIFNKLSGAFDSSETWWNHLKEQAINDTKVLLEDIERGEIQRRDEIMKRWRPSTPSLQ